MGNCEALAERIHVSSSQGSTRDGRYKLEIAAPGTDVVAARGFSSADRRWAAMTGEVTRLTTFHASDGACLLLTSTGTQPMADGPQPTRILIDGGRKTSYEAQTRAVLGELGPGAALNVVCVSHIDEDHIAGILRLVEDEVDSRAFQFLLSIEPTTSPAAAPPKPPPVGEVWHIGLFKLVGDDDAPVVESVLETVATILAGSPDDNVRLLASELDDLATGEKSSMELSRRLSNRTARDP